MLKRKVFGLMLLAILLTAGSNMATAAELPPTKQEITIITNTVTYQASGEPIINAVLPGPGSQYAIQTVNLAYYISGGEHVNAGSKLELFGYPTVGDTMAILWRETTGGLWESPSCATTWGSSCERWTGYQTGNGETWWATSSANIYWGSSSIIDNQVSITQSF